MCRTSCGISWSLRCPFLSWPCTGFGVCTYKPPAIKGESPMAEIRTGTKMQQESTKPKSELGGIVVLDFGGQYTQLIARRIREQRVFSAILPCTSRVEEILAYQPAGIVLSGGPSSVYDADAPKCDPGVLSTGVPVLGICYGMHWITKVLGGTLEPSVPPQHGPP